MKNYLLLLFLFFNLTVFAQTSDIEGEWTPDSNCWLGEIRIKHIDGDKYEVRFQTRDGAETINATYKDGKLSGSFEVAEPEYGEFWVAGNVSRGHENEYQIRVGAGGSYKSRGLASGYLNGNWDYRDTNSRSNCATVHETYCRVSISFVGGDMKVYFSFRDVYLKNGYSMFYQESGKGAEVTYTQW